VPEYRVSEESGPAHARRFAVEVWVAGARLAVGYGPSKRTAEQDAARAAEAFEARFSRGELSHDQLEEIRITVSDGSIGLAKLVAEAGLAASSSEATRKIQQGGVKVDRERVTDIKTRILASQGTITLEVGRRAVRIVLG